MGPVGQRERPELRAHQAALTALCAVALLAGCSGGGKTYDVAAVRREFAAHGVPLSAFQLHVYGDVKSLRAALTVRGGGLRGPYVLIFKVESSAKDYADARAAVRARATVERARNVVVVFGHVALAMEADIDASMRALRGEMGAARPPTRVERAALTQAVAGFFAPRSITGKVGRVRVTTRSRRFEKLAFVVFRGAKKGRDLGTISILLGRRNAGWRVLDYGSTEVGCSSPEAALMSDLGFGCP